MGKEKILVIEDNPLNMELVSDLLEAAGYAIHKARTAERGLRLADEISPDLILMDIGLPGMDGLVATGKLKNNPQTWDIPVIALTAHAMVSDRGKAMAAGCSDYITKPINTRALLKQIAKYL